VGGGSNFSGFAFPFLHQNFTAGRTTRVIAAEPAACPSLTKGVYTFDYGDTAEMAPIVKMHTLGHSFVPPGIHAGGLRYHGMAPHVCALYDHGDIEAVAVPQKATFEAAVQFARAEGILPAPESAHAIRVAIDETLRCKAEGVSRVVAFNLSGHGHFDLAAYDEFLHGRLEDFAYPEEQIRLAMERLPAVPAPA
jgi:tryptophan synthase beta chain